MAYYSIYPRLDMHGVVRPGKIALPWISVRYVRCRNGPVAVHQWRALPHGGVIQQGKLTKVADETRMIQAGCGLQSGQKVEMKADPFPGWAGSTVQCEHARSSWRSRPTNLLPVFITGILKDCEGVARRGSGSRQDESCGLAMKWQYRSDAVA